MDSEDDAILRLRSRAIPTMPTFPDLKSSLDGELSPGKGQQSSEDNHITSNGEKISTPSLVGPAESDLWYSESVDSTAQKSSFQ